MRLLAGIWLLSLLMTAAQDSPAGAAIQVASCDRGPVTIGSGPPDWRRKSVVAGPLGVFRQPLGRMSRARNGLLTKMPVLVEGHRNVWLRVPQRLRSRVFLYYGTFPDRQGRPITSFNDSPGFSEIEFRPCASKPRTVWPGGIRVRGLRPVWLMVTVEGRPDSVRLPLGRPIPYPAR